MTWMQTRDGAVVDLLNPDLSAVSIDEVAHALARINRFCGHTRTISGYSVAVHSVHVSQHCQPEDALWGLMHDAHEAFLGDITSPVKAALRALNGEQALRELERRLISAVRAKWLPNCRRLCPISVKVADLEALATERRDLLGPESQPWNLLVDGEPVKPWAEMCVPMSTQEGKRLFLMRYHELTGRTT